MAPTPAQEPDHIPDTRLVRARHAEIKPIQGNARRRTFALLAVTGAAVLGVHFLLGSDPPRDTDNAAPPAGSGPAPVVTYYVSTTGDDNAAGTSPSAAWRTLARASKQRFQPGERLLLKGGDRFTGELAFRPGQGGSAAKPVTVGSYGGGQAVIQVKAAAAPAVSVYDTAGVEIADLVVIGPGAGSSEASGIDIYNDLPGNRTLAHISVSNVDVSGFRNGIFVGGGNGASGFSDIRVSDSKLHGNRDNGLVSYGPTDAGGQEARPFHHFVVTGVEAYDNLGNPAEHTISTGNGISLGGVETGLIENSVAHGNGSRCDSLSGPVAIWAHDSTGVVIQHNVAYSNRTAGYTDGGGFDLDQRTDDSVMQYNLTYDNYGPGYMVWSATKELLSNRNTVRFNVSIDDARSPLDADSITYGALMLSGYEADASVYHNTVVQTLAGEQSPLLNLGTHLAGATVRDNIFVAQKGELVKTGGALSHSQVLLQGNDYYSASGHWRIGWGGTAYSSLSAWRWASGQERFEGRSTGSTANPQLAPAGIASWDPMRKTVPAPRAGSAVATVGLDLAARFGTDLGAQDYFGGSLTAPTMPGAVMPPASTPSAVPGHR